MAVASLFAAIALTLVSTPEQDRALSDSEALTRDALLSYVGCVRDRAIEFEPSGESAEAIATSAIAACREFRQQAQLVMGLNVIVKNRLSASDARQIVDRVLSDVDRDIRNDAVLAVVRARSLRVSQ